MAINQLKAGALLSYVSIGLNNIIGLTYMSFMLCMMGQSEYVCILWWCRSLHI